MVAGSRLVQPRSLTSPEPRERSRARGRGALAPFPFGAGGRIAASPDGKHVVFNGGDWLFTAEQGQVGGRISNEASYEPLFTPDGKSLVFRREKGKYDGVEGRYELST